MPGGAAASAEAAGAIRAGGSVRGGARVLEDPGVHGHRPRGRHVDGAGGAVLADAQQTGAASAQLGADALALGAEDHEAVLGQRRALQGLRPGAVVDADDLVALRGRPGEQLTWLGVVTHVQVAVGDHGAALVPAASADDVDAGDVEGVGAAHDRADVEVLADVLDGDVQPVGAGGQVGADRRDAPVAVAVDDVAPVASREQLGVVAGVGGPGPGTTGPGADADLADVGRPVLLRQIENLFTARQFYFGHNYSTLRPTMTPTPPAASSSYH